MKTAVSIPDNVFSLAEQFAKQHKMTRSSLFTVAVDEYIHHHREEGVTQKLDAIYGKEDSSIDPAIVRLQSRSLPKEEW